MRIEQPYFFFYGALIVVIVWALSFVFSSAHIRTFLRTMSLSLGFGTIVIPGHGELIVAPILAALMMPSWRLPLIGLGVTYFLIWWALVYAVFRLLHQKK
jgi:hypothetical protein